MILIKNLHHLISIVNNIEKTVGFYINVLGMQEETFQSVRKAVRFVTEKNIEEFLIHFRFHEVNVEEVPVTRTGTLGALTFVYTRDLDQNLIVVSQFVKQKRP
ncbi:hypothetical protein [Priestia endophytica]|uniref:hypothetical protein n=1 Tax=Priestia endophytica TaxID=135735 RepID=UPI000FBFDC18|nr:hypothetical protein [Priestia endophytica]RPK05989.1 hypothetical protein FH5_01925 [Priestia endophytica]